MKRSNFKLNINSRRGDMNLLKLMAVSGVEILNSFKRQKITELVFPERVKGYEFQNVFPKVGVKESFGLAVYKSPMNKKAVGKIWMGGIKNLSYYTFKNEISVYEALNSAYKRTKAKLPKRLKSLYIPQLLHAVEKDNYLFALIELMPGKTADNLSSSKKLDVYSKCIDFLYYLGSNLSLQERRFITVRRPTHYLFLYPFILAKALVTQPAAFKFLIRGSFIYLKMLPSLFSSYEPSLTHRDLHFRNILVSSEKISIIDLQFIVFSERLQDVVTTLRYRWLEDDFYQLLYQWIFDKYRNKPSLGNIFTLLCINSVTHGLTDRNFPKEKIAKWIDFLKYFTSKSLKLKSADGIYLRK